MVAADVPDHPRRPMTLPPVAKQRSDVPFAAFLRRIARSRLHAMIAYEEGTRAGDPEAVHDLRVATRRLRSALRLARGLSLRHQHLRRQERVLKTLADALGQVRDLDVLLGRLVSDEAHAPPEDLPHLERLIATLEGRRAAGRERMDACVADFGRPRTIARLEKLFGAMRARRIRSHPNRTRDPGITPDMPTLGAARTILPQLLDEIGFLAPAVSDPGAEREHHRLRIAVKRLRYAMETFAPLFPPELGDRIQLLRQIQDLLGRVHDDDVFVPIFERYLADRRMEKDQRLKTAVFNSSEVPLTLNDVRRAIDAGASLAEREAEREAILRLIARTRAHRREVFAEFQALWREMERRGFSAALRAEIDAGDAGGPGAGPGVESPGNPRISPPG